MAAAGGGWRAERMVICPRGGGESAVARFEKQAAL